MRLVHRRKERVLTRSTVPLLSQLTYRLSRCCYCSEEKTLGTGLKIIQPDKERCFDDLIDLALIAVEVCTNVEMAHMYIPASSYLSLYKHTSLSIEK